MSTPLRTVKQIVIEEGLDKLYLVVPNPHWADFEPDRCPAPILEWLKANSPDATIERVAGAREWLDSTFRPEEPLHKWYREYPDLPAFRLLMDSGHADAFPGSWRQQYGDRGTDDFYFIDAGPFGPPDDRWSDDPSRWTLYYVEDDPVVPPSSKAPPFSNELPECSA